MDPATLKSLQQQFTEALPLIERTARRHFRKRDPERQDELVQEACSAAWRDFVRRYEAGHDPMENVGPNSTFVSKQAARGDRMAGLGRAKDAMSPLIQKRFGFKIIDYPDATEEKHATVMTNRSEPDPADLAAFKADYISWLERLPPPRRAMVEDMADGYSTAEIAEKHAVKPENVTYVRKKAFKDWLEFQGEDKGR